MSGTNQLLQDSNGRLLWQSQPSQKRLLKGYAIPSGNVTSSFTAATTFQFSKASPYSELVTLSYPNMPSDSDLTNFLDAESIDSYTLTGIYSNLYLGEYRYGYTSYYSRSGNQLTFRHTYGIGTSDVNQSAITLLSGKLPYKRITAATFTPTFSGSPYYELSNTLNNSTPHLARGSSLSGPVDVTASIEAANAANTRLYICFSGHAKGSYVTTLGGDSYLDDYESTDPADYIIWNTILKNAEPSSSARVTGGLLSYSWSWINRP